MEKKDQLNAIEAILMPKMMEWNTRIDSLRQKLGIELRRLLQLQATFLGSENLNFSFFGLFAKLASAEVSDLVAFVLSSGCVLALNKDSEKDRKTTRDNGLPPRVST